MKFYLSVIMMLFTANSFAVTNSYVDDIREFFILLRSGETDEAIDSIYSSYPRSFNPDDILEVKTQLSSLPKRAGKITDLERGEYYYVNRSLAVLTYIITYGEDPIIFTFKYRAVDDGWVIHSFSIDESILEDISSATIE